ncbi:MAG: hypothetical protein R6W76_10375 [Caldilinea sp.]
MKIHGRLLLWRSGLRQGRTGYRKATMPGIACEAGLSVCGVN